MLRVTDHYNDNVPYFNEFYNKIQKKQLTTDQFVVQSKKRMVFDANESDDKGQL